MCGAAAAEAVAQLAPETFRCTKSKCPDQQLTTSQPALEPSDRRSTVRKEPRRPRLLRGQALWNVAATVWLAAQGPLPTSSTTLPKLLPAGEVCHDL